MLELALTLFVTAVFLFGVGCTMMLIRYSKCFRNYVHEQIKLIEKEESEL